MTMPNPTNSSEDSYSKPSYVPLPVNPALIQVVRWGIRLLPKWFEEADYA